MLLYHASPVPGLTELRPFVSNHGTSCVYLSEKRENTLVYLSNAVEKYCRETGFLHSGIWQKWASYGFTKNGLLCLDEYYANATFETYCGVQGCVRSQRAKSKFAGVSAFCSQISSIYGTFFPVASASSLRFTTIL